MLTARVEERDKLLGFEIGADDYITKPFSMRELLARVAAQLRRVAPRSSRPRTRSSRTDDLERRPRALQRRSSKGERVHLTKKEFDLLWLLIRSRGRVVTRDTILSRLWDYDADIETRTVDVHIRSLRHKLGDERHRDGRRPGIPLPRGLRRISLVRRSPLADLAQHRMSCASSSPSCSARPRRRDGVLLVVVSDATCARPFEDRVARADRAARSSTWPRTSRRGVRGRDRNVLATRGAELGAGSRSSSRTGASSHDTELPPADVDRDGEPREPAGGPRGP